MSTPHEDHEATTRYGPTPPADPAATRYGDTPPSPDAVGDPAATRYSDAPADPDATAYTPASGGPVVPGRLPRRFGGYELLEELGRGGMGVVFKARQLGLNRVVALKMILSGDYAGPEERARFRAEAEAVARLQHPHIVQIYEVGEYEGQLYFSLEFCPGGSLDRKLNRTPLPPREAARLVETLARAVHAAHQQQVIHRDLKPANVLLTADGQPKVTDFGLAKKLDEAGQTQSGAVMGTPSYMAPEQATGKTREIGPAADVYALGAVLYECLTGRPPFKAATTLETLLQVVSDDPAPPRQLQSKTPRDLETVCLKCLQKERSRRYDSAAALADDLERWRKGEPVAARAAGRLYRLGKFVRRHKVLVGGTALVLLVLLGGVIGTSIGLVRAWADEAQLRIEKIRSHDLDMEKLAQSHYDAAQLAKGHGAWRSTLDEIDKAKEAGFSDSPALHLDRVQAWCALHDMRQAEREIQDLAKRSDLGDLQGRVLLWRADLALNHNWRDEQALRQVQQALEQKLPAAEEAYARGLLAATSPEAVDHFREAIQADPFSERANGALGQLLILLGKFPEARERVHVGELLFPDDPTFPLLHAELEALQGHADAADLQLKRAEAGLNTKQAESARILVDLADQVPTLPALFSADASLPAALARIAPLALRAQSLVGDTDADLFLPTAPVLIKAFKGLGDVGLTGFLFNKAGVVKELGHATDIHPEGFLFLTRGLLLSQRDDKEGWTAAEKDFVRASEESSILPIGPQALYMAAAAEGMLDKDYGPQPEMRQRSLDHIRQVVALGGLQGDQFNNLTGMARWMTRGSKDKTLARHVVGEWARQFPNDPRLPEQQAGVEFDAGSYGRVIELVDAQLAKKPGGEEEKHWREVRAKAVELLQAQAREAAPAAEWPGK